MSSELGRAVLELATDDKKLDRGLKDAERQTKGWGDKIAGIAGKAAIAIGGIGLAAAAAGFKFAQAAAEEEVGIRRLETAIRNTGQTIDDDFRAEIERAIAEMSAMSAFSDGELRESLSLLVAQTGDYEEAINRQKIAMDLARGTGMDLTAASQLLGKVTDENVNVLKRYGIAAEEGMTAQELLNEVQARFSDQAQEFADSAAGQWQTFQNTVGDLQEEIGGLLLPTFEKFVSFAIAGIHVLRTQAVPGLQAALAALREKGAPVFEFIGGIVTNVVMPGLRRVIATVPLIFGSLGEIFDVLTGKRPEAGGVLSELVGPDAARNIMQIVAQVRETMRDAFDLVKPIIQGVIDKVAELRTKFEELPPAIQAFAGVALAAKATGFDDFLLNIVNTAATVASGVYDMSRAFAFFSTVSLVGAIKLFPTWIGLQWLSVTAGAAFLLTLLPFIALGAAIGVTVGLIIVFWDDLAASFQALAGIIGHVLGWIVDQLRQTWDFWAGIWQKISEDPPKAIGFVLGFLLTALPRLHAFIVEFVEKAKAAFGEWVISTISAAARLWQDVQAAFQRGVDHVVGILLGVKDRAVEAAKELGRGIFYAIADFIGRLPELAGQAIQGLISAVVGGIQSFLSGLDIGRIVGERIRLPFIGAADGFEGVVTRPTMFMVAEGGRPEHVRVSPNGPDDRPVELQLFIEGRAVGKAVGKWQVRRTALAGRPIG